MSALGIYDSVLDTAPAFPMPGARVALALTGLAAGLTVLGIAGRIGAGTDRGGSTEIRPAVVTPPSGGAFSAIGLATRPRPADPIADFMRHGLVPEASMPKAWVPDAMGSPDICRLARIDVRWSIVSITDPLMRRAMGSRHPHAMRRHRQGRTPTDAIAAFEALPPLDTTELDVVSVDAGGVHGLGNPTTRAENRRPAAIGTAADALQFDDRPGELSAAAQAGLWNGTPATAMGIGYTLPNRIRLDAMGVTNVNTWTNVGKTFQVSTVASIPLE